MKTELGPLVEVIRRNLRWEVAIDGVTEPLVDWFFSRGRAVVYAIENARVLGASRICVMHADGTVDTWLTAERAPLSEVA